MKIVPGKPGEGRRYRSPANIRYLTRVVERSLEEGRQPNPKLLEDLNRAIGYDQRKRSELAALLRKAGQKPLKPSKGRGLEHKTTNQVTAQDLGLRPVISFDLESGQSFQKAVAAVQERLNEMPKGTRVESVLSSLPKEKRTRFSWAVIILGWINRLGIEIEKVRAVHVSEKRVGGYVVAGVKKSGRTFWGEFGEI